MAAEDRPLSAVLNDIVDNAQEIIRSEVRLAKAELREELAKSTHAAVWFGVGALSALLALFFLLFPIFFALTYIVPDWAAALLIAFALAVICAIGSSVAAGHWKKIRQIQSSASVTQLKENVEWAKQQL